MFFKGLNGCICFIFSGFEIFVLFNIDEFIENIKECVKIIGNLDFWEEMFGQDFGFMDDNFGG